LADECNEVFLLACLKKVFRPAAGPGFPLREKYLCVPGKKVENQWGTDPVSFGKRPASGEKNGSRTLSQTHTSPAGTGKESSKTTTAKLRNKGQMNEAGNYFFRPAVMVA